MSKIRDLIYNDKKLKLKNDVVRLYKENRIIVSLGSSPDPPKRKRSISTAAIKDPDDRPQQQQEEYLRMQVLKRAMPGIPITGYPRASRVVIKQNADKTYSLLVEGYGLLACMTTEGVDGNHTTTNSVVETRQVLGIEAARQTIIYEVDAVMGEMDIDPRHIQLLADVMTYRGEVLGITRFGLAKMRDSILQLASFEKTPDHLFDAAWHGKTDRIEGVSECIIMGQSVGLGTGAIKVVRPMRMTDRDVGRKECVFEDVWQDVMGRKSRR